MNCQDKGPALTTKTTTTTNKDDPSHNKKIATYPIVIPHELDETWKIIREEERKKKELKGVVQPWKNKVVSPTAEEERGKNELKAAVQPWENKVVSSPSENDILTEEEQLKSAEKRKDKPKVLRKNLIGESFNGNVTMRDKKGGALSRVQKLKKRLSHSFGRLSISKEEADETPNPVQLAYTGYSEEFLDRLEPNGNLTTEKKSDRYDWTRIDHERVHRQLSVSSDSKLLDEDIREEAIVILRPRRPPRPKSEVFLSGEKPRRKTKRFSAFGGDSPFGKTEAYVKLEQLGMGSYATVYKGYSNLTNQVVALKEIRLQEDEGAPFTAIREASLLKELKHSNIVTLHDIIHTRVTLTFVFEYVHTDLSQYMEIHSRPNRGLSPPTAKLFLFQLLRGLAYCHRRRVLHRDVKPQNLLISEIGELKLADFGLARAKSVPSHTYSHEVVTLWYRPPDVLLGSTEYSTSLDMWGVGCIFVEMLTGVPTFPGVHCTHDQLEKIFKVLGTPTEETWPGVTHLPGYKANRLVFYPTRKLGITFPRLYDIAEAETIASALLQLNPDQRIGADEALQHPYFASFPRNLFELPDEVSIFSVEGLYSYFNNESRSQQSKGQT